MIMFRTNRVQLTKVLSLFYEFATHDPRCWLFATFWEYILENFRSSRDNIPVKMCVLLPNCCLLFLHLLFLLLFWLFCPTFRPRTDQTFVFRFVFLFLFSLFISSQQWNPRQFWQCPNDVLHYRILTIHSPWKNGKSGVILVCRKFHVVVS